VIEINELTKYYGERRAVGPLSVSIQRGEVVGLLGLNGAGKTTTLRMLSSDLLPTSGTMRIDGVDLVDEPERVRPKIGYLPDRPPLYIEMTVREYLQFAARLRGMPSARIAARLDEVLQITSLRKHADERIDTLSHGFRQRVGIAQAIVHQPSLLLLDEPISGLDPVQIVEMRNLIRSLRGEHTTVLSSHILSEISETCDRLLVIRDGQIVASGSEAQLSAQMSSVYTFEITVLSPPEYRTNPGVAVREIAERVEGITGAVVLPADEPGDGVARLRVSGKHDVRAELCKAFVAANVGILRLERSARELESVFLELTGKEEAGKEEAA
jgi:ABC-2 type transport system ATP-binding protein